MAQESEPRVTHESSSSQHDSLPHSCSRATTAPRCSGLAALLPAARLPGPPDTRCAATTQRLTPGRFARPSQVISAAADGAQAASMRGATHLGAPGRYVGLGIDLSKPAGSQGRRKHVKRGHWANLRALSEALASPGRERHAVCAGSPDGLLAEHAARGCGACSGHPLSLGRRLCGRTASSDDAAVRAFRQSWGVVARLVLRGKDQSGGRSKLAQGRPWERTPPPKA